MWWVVDCYFPGMVNNSSTFPGPSGWLWQTKTSKAWISLVSDSVLCLIALLHLLCGRLPCVVSQSLQYYHEEYAIQVVVVVKPFRVCGSCHDLVIHLDPRIQTLALSRTSSTFERRSWLVVQCVNEVRNDSFLFAPWSLIQSGYITIMTFTIRKRVKRIKDTSVSANTLRSLTFLDQ